MRLFRRRPKLYRWDNNYSPIILTTEDQTYPPDPTFLIPDNYHLVPISFTLTLIAAAGIRAVATAKLNHYRGSTLLGTYADTANVGSSTTTIRVFSTHYPWPPRAYVSGCFNSPLPGSLSVLPGDYFEYVIYDVINGDQVTNWTLHANAYELY